MDNDTYDDRTNIRFLKQEEFNANIVKRLESIEDFRAQTLIRLNQEIENRTKAFERIKELEDYNETYNEKHQTNKNYSFQRRIEKLEDYRVKTYLKLERIDDILVVHRNQTDNQRKNFCALRRVLDDKVMDLLEKGEHGEHK